VSRPAPRRVWRTLVAAICGTALGAPAHLAGAGVPDPATLVGALVLTALATWPMSAREQGFLTIGALQLGAQQLVHLALSTGGGHEHTGALPYDLMVLGHLLAGLLTALVLAEAERRVWTGARALAARVRRWWRGLGGPVTAAPPRRARRPLIAPAAGWRRQPLWHAVVRRGPPLGAR
jgi:hypothetical protein